MDIGEQRREVQNQIMELEITLRSKKMELADLNRQIYEHEHGEGSWTGCSCGIRNCICYAR